ncbi:MAG: uncharacterized protein QOJ70_963 [Acidobacteriota bacterium]|jgi:uncharacterized protein (DUF2062 family)|nr:uncharacterized protein [Acidobacteriota bacterium]MDT7807150.1 uncharacterized protein [Acidobacteriota bacterium]
MLRSALRRLLALDDPPERTALAFSVGVLIAFSPFLGFHTIIATVLALLFRFNKVAIYSGTFVNNPFLTLVPIILASYAVGAFMLGRPLSLPPGGLELLREPHLLTAEYRRELFAQFRSLLLPFALGGMVLSVVCSLAAYPVTLKLLRANQRRKTGV